MGMTQTFHRATDAQIDELLAASDRPAVFRAFLVEPEEVLKNAESAYLDKAFAALNFLLTGSNDGGETPLDFIRYDAKRGLDIGEVGFGLAHAFTSEEVKRIADALMPITSEELRKRYDPALMAELEIYPAYMWLEESMEDPQTGLLMHLESPAEVDERNLDYLLGNYERLKAFILKAAAESMGVVTYCG
jgi:hypothetical protein